MNFFSQFARSKGDPKVLRKGRSSMAFSDRTARRLGWLSIGLGLGELIAARRIAGAVGLEGREWLIRVFGAREIASGMLTLSTEKQLGLWSRVAGDALDIGTLIVAMGPNNRNRNKAGRALLLVLGVTAVDIVTARAVARRHRRTGGLRSYAARSGFPQGLAAARRSAHGRSKSTSNGRAAGTKQRVQKLPNFGRLETTRGADRQLQ